MSPGRLKITDKSLGRIKTSHSCRLGEDVLCTAVSRDGSRMAFGSYGKIAYYAGKKERFRKDISKLSSIALSASGERILLTTYENCHLLDEKGEQLWEYGGEEGVDIATLSADGETILVTSEKDLFAYDGSGRKLWGHVFPDRIWSLAVSEDGNHVAIGTGKAVYGYRGGKPGWDYRTGKLVLKVRLTPDGRRCSFTSNRNIFFFKDGLMEWSVPTEYCREVGMSTDGGFIVAGLSIDILALSASGEKSFDYMTRDFITRLEVAASGECVAVGNGSDVFRSGELICLDSQGKELWRYRANGRINDVAVSYTGRYVTFCDNKKGIAVDNRKLVARATERVIESGRELMLSLIDEEIDVAQEKQMLIDAEKLLKEGKNDEGLTAAKKAYISCKSLKESFVEARERVPVWMEKLGYQPKAAAGLGGELVRTVFPVYVMHKRLEESASLKNMISRYQKRYSTYQESMKTIDLKKLRSELGEDSSAVKEVESRMLHSSIASLSLNRIIGRLESLDYQRIQYIFGLENRTRSIILDRIDGRDCRTKVREAEEEARIYLARLEATMDDVAQQAHTIDSWMVSEMKGPSEHGIEIVTDYLVKEKDFKIMISLKNTSSTRLLNPALHIFTNLDESDIIAPASGIELSTEPLEPGNSVDFSFLAHMNAVQNQGINGFFEFKDDEENIIRVKLDSLSSDILVPFIEPLILAENQYTSTRGKGRGNTMNKGLDVEAGSLLEACERIIGAGGEMYVARGAPPDVDNMNSAIIWLSGQVGEEKLLAGFTLTRNTESSTSIHIDMSVYCKNMNFTRKFLGEFEKKLLV